MGTKDKILSAGLKLFSEYGYSDVCMKEIAKEAGIKAPSIYKHFKSKQELFDTILDNSVIRLDEKIHHAEDYQVDLGYKVGLDIERLAIDIFNYLINDYYVSRVRKMISIEMYRNPQIMNYYVDSFIEKPRKRQEEIIEFYGLADCGELEVLSTIFYSPILLAVKLYDSNSANEEELKDLLKESYKRLQYLLL